MRKYKLPTMIAKKRNIRWTWQQQPPHPKTLPSDSTHLLVPERPNPAQNESPTPSPAETHPRPGRDPDLEPTVDPGAFEKSARPPKNPSSRAREDGGRGGAKTRDRLSRAARPLRVIRRLRVFCGSVNRGVFDELRTSVSVCKCVYILWTSRCITNVRTSP